MLGGCKVKTISCHLSLLPNKCKYSIGGKNWVRAENLLTGKYFILWVTLYSDIYYIHDTFSCCLWARVEFLSQLTMEMKQDVQKWEVRKYMVYWKPAGSVAWPELRLLVTWDSRIWLTVGLSQALNVGVFIKDFQQGVAQTAVHFGKLTLSQVEYGQRWAGPEDGSCCRTSGDTRGSRTQLRTLGNTEQCQDPRGTEGGEIVSNYYQGSSLDE